MLLGYAGLRRLDVLDHALYLIYAVKRVSQFYFLDDALGIDEESSGDSGFARNIAVLFGNLSVRIEQEGKCVLWIILEEITYVFVRLVFINGSNGKYL